MNKRILFSTIAAGAATAAIIPVLAATGPVASAATSTSTYSATTTLTNRPDSGINGDWALDSISRTATIIRHGTVSANNCGGISPCYLWSGKITDKGTFATTPGQDSPGAGLQNGNGPLVMGATVTGPMHGNYNYSFYSTVKTPDGTVPSTVDGNNDPTGQWPALFFAGGTSVLYDFSGNTGNAANYGTTGSWTYTAPLGADSACPHDSSQWVDASPDWGSKAVDGNILAPDAAHC